jgi:hypothetical protein
MVHKSFAFLAQVTWKAEKQDLRLHWMQAPFVSLQSMHLYELWSPGGIEVYFAFLPVSTCSSEFCQCGRWVP